MNITDIFIKHKQLHSAAGVTLTPEESVLWDEKGEEYRKEILKPIIFMKDEALELGLILMLHDFTVVALAFKTDAGFWEERLIEGAERDEISQFLGGGNRFVPNDAPEPIDAADVIKAAIADAENMDIYIADAKIGLPEQSFDESWDCMDPKRRELFRRVFLDNLLEEFAKGSKAPFVIFSSSGMPILTIIWHEASRIIVHNFLEGQEREAFADFLRSEDSLPDFDRI